MIQLLDDTPPDYPFPPLEHAEEEPDGLLAVGGDLTPDRLLNAYRHGIFPWYAVGQPILWWSPNPRMVLFPESIRVSRSLRKTLRTTPLDVTFDQAFPAVIQACSEPRELENDPGTWITPEMIAAYNRLHQIGRAHSVEVWLDGELVGGLYGIAIGAVFFGESMFSRVSNASKIALVQLARQLSEWNYHLIDCQVYSDHLVSLGAEAIPRSDFSQLLDRYCAAETNADQSWNNSHE